MTSAGYEDGNDANALRRDPMFKMALDLSPVDRELCSQSTISRLENIPDVRAVLRMGRAMVDLSCKSFATVPKGSRWTSTTRSMRSTVVSSCGCSTPTTTNTDFSRSSCSTARAASSPPCFVPPSGPGGKEIKPFLRRLLRAIRAHWPNTEILLRADSHYCGREVLDWCRANGLDYILGVAPTATLRRHVEGLEASTKAKFEAAPRDGKLRRFMEFFDGAQSWSRVERIIARIEAGAEGPDTRFVVTNLSNRNARRLYEDVYCRQAGRKPYQV